MSPLAYARRKLWQPVLQQLTQGLAPEKLALTIAIGFVIAVIPIIGTTTVLCTALAIMLRLNQPVIQLINYLSAPLQVACILPWIRAGEFLFRAEAMKLSPTEVVKLVTNQPGVAISTLWVSTLHAAVAWLVAAPLLGVAIYFSVLPFLRMATVRMKKAAPVPDEALDAG